MTTSPSQLTKHDSEHMVLPAQGTYIYSLTESLAHITINVKVVFFLFFFLNSKGIKKILKRRRVELFCGNTARRLLRVLV